jgi:predicted O-linked N-acetylglucosamine transferase (SPINDLY family)
MFRFFNNIRNSPANTARQSNGPTTEKSPHPSRSISTQDDLPNEDTSHKKRGNEFLAKGMLEEAAECYRQAVTINPGSAEGYLNLGFVLREQKLYEDAERYLKQAILINPAMEDAYYLLGGILQERGNLAGAIENYKKSLELKPDFEIVYGTLCHVLFQSGQVESAKKVIKQGLSLNPESAEFHSYLGSLYVDEKKFEKAIACYHKALSIQPDYAEVHGLLGNVFNDQGNLDEAKACYRKALALNPDDTGTYNKLGIIFQTKGDFDEAAACYRKALVIKPDSFEANNNLGAVFHDQGDLDEAQACYRRALALNHDDAGVHSNLGTIFLDRADLDEAQACFRRALVLSPGCTDALNNLGIVFKKQGKLNEAVACYREALALRDDLPKIYNNLGNVLRDQGNLDEAQACYSKALALNPDDAEVYNNLGVVFQDRLSLDEAVDCFSKALMLKPDDSMVHNNLGLIFQDQGKLVKSLACYRQAVELKPEFHAAKMNMLHVMQLLCEWNKLDLFSGELRRGVREITSPTDENLVAPFSFLTLPGATPAEQMLCAANWAKGRTQSVISEREEMGFAFKREPKAKIHIGYFSADFRNHPVAHLMAEVFEIHDRDRFQISAYSFGPDDGSAMRQRLENAFDHFVDIRDLNHENAARKIYEDHVDILVDLTGYTKHFRSAVLAMRPAPIQVNYLGYPGTMGASFIDYLIADRFLITPEQRKCYTEKVAWLPDSYMPRDSSCRRLAAPSRKDCGLPDKSFVFCSFNPSYKITPAIFNVWCRLLKAVPGSVLWMSSSNPDAESNLRREAGNRGVDPARIITAPRLDSIDEHLARVQCADLFLDTTPYNAHTTCSDGLWMGLPVITCAGETFPSRVAGSLLTALGVPELITYSLEDYYALALDLATDRIKYGTIRNKIFANRESAPLFDSTKFTRDLEAVYLQMWDKYVPPHTD